MTIATATAIQITTLDMHRVGLVLIVCSEQPVSHLHHERRVELVPLHPAVPKANLLSARRAG